MCPYFSLRPPAIFSRAFRQAGPAGPRQPPRLIQEAIGSSSLWTNLPISGTAVLSTRLRTSLRSTSCQGRLRLGGSWKGLPSTNGPRGTRTTSSRLRAAVRANAVPAISTWRGDDNSRDARQVASFGRAAFDFIESRWGKPGVRQFLFALRQSSRSGADPFVGAFQIARDEFDRAFEQYLRERFAVVADPSPAARFDYRATIQLEGQITAIRAPVEEGLACIELWVSAERGSSQRWGVECGREASDVVRGLKPGDRVIVTGPQARDRTAQRMLVQNLERPSDGFAWRAQSK